MNIIVKNSCWECEMLIDDIDLTCALSRTMIFDDEMEEANADDIPMLHPKCPLRNGPITIKLETIQEDEEIL